MFRLWMLDNLFRFEGEGGGGSSGGGNEPELPKDAAELRKLLDAEAAATRRAIEKDQKTAIETAVTAALTKAEEDAKAAAKLKLDEEAGNFKGIREGLEKERDDAKTLAQAKEAEAADKAARLERAEKLLKGRLDERVKALDHEDLKDVKADYLARFPDDTAPLLDRIDYLDDPRTVAAIAKVDATKSAAETAANTRRDQFRSVAGAAPVHNGTANPDDADALAARRSQSHIYR